jgi:hypothetical protein
MTKRELIDQILQENETAEPGFLAQFSDEQLREYLTHLKWLKQPHLQGDASRFERYFRPSPSVAAPPARWRAARNARGDSAPEALDLSVPSETSLDAVPEAAPPPPAAPDSPPPAPPSRPAGMRYVDYHASPPIEDDDLEDMQLSAQERTVLTPPAEDIEEADELPAEPEAPAPPAPPAAESPPSERVSDDQTWLF